MIVIKPEVVTTTKLIASNVPISDFPLWVSGTNYSIGQRVYFQPMGAPYPRDYEAIMTVGGAHHSIPPNENPTHWLDIGASKRFKMFDGSVSDGTINAGSINVTLDMGAIITGLSLFNVDAASVQVIVTDPIDGIIYDNFLVLDNYDAIISWVAYYSEPVGERQTDFNFLDLPSNYPAATVQVIANNGASPAKIGELVLGTQTKLAVTNFGTEIGITSYSRKEVDQFGNFIIVKRKNAKRVTYDVTYETNQLYRAQQFFANIDSTACVFIGDENRQETIVYGFYREFSVVISNPSISSGSIQVDGLT